MGKFRFGQAAVGLLFGILCVSLGTAAADQDPLRAGFKSPPNSARPRVWWHWMSGNITKEGIEADLEWMHKTGIGGFQNFDADLQTPKVVEKRLAFMTPAWKDAFHFAMVTANKLGLETAIAGSPGWSESGGPWVTPDAGMKKVVWSETTIEGGKPYAGSLAQPPSNAGPFQDAPFLDRSVPVGGSGPGYYQDTRVIAFRVPAAENTSLMARAHVTSSSGAVDASVLADGSLTKAIAIPRASVGESTWLQFAFDQPETVRAVTFAKADHGAFEQFSPDPGPAIEASDDAKNWRTVATVPVGGAERHTVAFPAVTAKYFRAVWKTAPPPPPMPGIDWIEVLGGMGLGAKPSTEHHISELSLESGARVDHAEEKSGFGLLADLSSLATPAASVDAVVAKGDVMDVTEHMKPDGSFAWTPPAGKWRVLRLGYSLTGITNHPASPEATGLEVDKLSARHVTDYMSHYLDMYKDATQGLMGKQGLQNVINDSWEAGTANWTEDLLMQFKTRRGYDATPWLPVLTGRVVGSASESDRFLWDYRQTLYDLLAENHYDLITKLLHDRGMGHYGESHESGRAFLGDGMEAKRSDDVPMAAMWTLKPGLNPDNPGYNADVRESASVAHIYGQNLVAAESMTAAAAPWRWSPATLKPTADKELAMGLNRFVIHTSVHQPLMDKGPGLGLGPFGQWFTRNETWSGAGAKAWIDYLARSSWMLQQGHFVADVAWYYGEDSNITALYGRAAPPIPEGFPFDYVNADIVRHKLKASGGRLVTESGMSYRVLAMDERAAHMSLPVLKALRDLVAEGAVIVGPRPVGSPSLADSDTEYEGIVRQVWGEGGVNVFGKGKAYTGTDLVAALAAEKAAPDFRYTKTQPDTQLLAVHRKLTDGDLYYIDNRSEHAQSTSVSLRASGRLPEVWHAESGRSESTSWHRDGDRTVVPLELGPWETVFVVMRKPTTATSASEPVHAVETAATLEGQWHVAFQPGRHAPETAELSLASWSENSDDRIKYFAGTGTYTRTINVPAKWLQKGTQLWLDLGEVHELAEVSVNGKSLGVSWRPQYKVDISSAVHAGENKLDIAVTDSWANRLIHDARPGATDTFTTIVPSLYKGTEPLMAAGLVGPVTLLLRH